jgi:hypothetical protein
MSSSNLKNLMWMSIRLRLSFVTEDWDSDLDQIVRKICLDHQAQVTGYNDLVKGHIDPSKQKKKKKIATKNVPPPPPPAAETQQEKSPEQAIPSPTLEPAANATTSPRPTEPVPVALPVHEENPPQKNVSEEGEIPRSERQASPAQEVPNVSVPHSATQTTSEEQHPQSPVPDHTTVSIAKVSDPSPLRISLNTARRTSDVDPSAAKSASAHHSDSVIYGDEVISVEDELKYPYPCEQLPLFSIGVGVKGPLFNRNTHPLFFQESPYSKPRTSESPRFWTQEQAIYYS